MTSLCTAKAIREYFLEGKLPKSGLFCPTDEVLFPPKNETVDSWANNDLVEYSEEDLRLLKAMKELGKEMDHFVGSFKRPRSLF